MAEGWLLLLGGLVSACAAFVGGLTGFGYSLLATPFLLLIGLDLATTVPVNLILGLTGRIQGAIYLRRHIDVTRVALMLAGTLPGFGVGMWLVSTVDGSLLRRAIGVIIILALVLLVLAPQIARQPRAVVFGVGLLSGVLGTGASLNGVPPAVLYTAERRSPATFMADLSAYLVISSAFIAAGAAAAHDDRARLANYIGWWLVPVLAATWASTILGSRLSQALFRKIVLSILTASALMLVIVA